MRERVVNMRASEAGVKRGRDARKRAGKRQPHDEEERERKGET